MSQLQVTYIQWHSDWSLESAMHLVFSAKQNYEHTSFINLYCEPCFIDLLRRKSSLSSIIAYYQAYSINQWTDPLCKAVHCCQLYQNVPVNVSLQ